MFQIGDLAKFRNVIYGERDETISMSEDERQKYALERIKIPVLVLGAQSDVLFPIWQQKEMSDGLKEAGNNNVTYYELDAQYGHDTFLIDVVNVGGAIKGHLEMF